MNLVDFVVSGIEPDDELTIYIENLEDPNSEIVLQINDDGYTTPITQGNKTYHYLIEAFSAIEFVEDYLQSLDYKPTDSEIAQRLFDYAINDA